MLTDRIAQALALAVEAHDGQRRKGTRHRSGRGVRGGQQALLHGWIVAARGDPLRHPSQGTGSGDWTKP